MMHIQGEKGKLYMWQAYGGYSEDILIGFSLKTDVSVSWPQHIELAVCAVHNFCQ